jgi:hypothetical protein
MHFQSIILTSLVAATAIASALPESGPMPDGLTPISSKKLPSGSTVVVYGETGGIAKRGWWDPPKPKYCHTTTSPECDDKNGGPTETCNELLNELLGDRSRVQPNGARQYCVKAATDKYCCVKWTKEVPGLTNGDMADKFEAGMF